jgi:orotate phosphoribosyltransferase
MHVAIVRTWSPRGLHSCAIERAEDAGLSVSRVLAIVDRNEGGADAISEKGYRLEAMFLREDVENA